METTKSGRDCAVLVGTEQGVPSTVTAVPAGAPRAREPMATLPDGVPSMLWEEAVESERYVADGPPLTSPALGSSPSRGSSGGKPTGR